MPATLSYPGVYVEEIPSGVRTITGVATSITAFIGRAARGPTEDPITINSFGDFSRIFGGLGVQYPMSYAVRDFYLNGGSQAIIVRLYKETAGSPATATLDAKGLKLVAAAPGTWGNLIRARVDDQVSDEVAKNFGLTAADLFNLTVRDTGTNATETFLNVTVAESPRRIDRVLKAQSSLVRFDDSAPLPSSVPSKHADAAAGKTIWEDDNASTPVASGDNAVNSADLAASADFEGDQAKKTGLYMLDKADLFNLLCVPPDTRDGDTPIAFYQTAMKYCADRRAMLIVDSPAAWSENKDTAAATARDGMAALNLSGPAARNAAIFFPRVVQSDPLRDDQLDVFVPSGIVAGVVARTDANRGVWKAPAGLDAAMNGIQGLQVNLNDAENGMLNPLGINCLRAFPATGRVVWGARTLRGSDQLSDEYKYIPVRRTALYIEESLYRGLKWVVFEPNDEPLWAQIRLNVGAFMHNLFRQGAFQGTTPKDAYFVKCDKETTTQNDINLGIVNIVVGFAPLKPAEFVVIKLQQMAGQIEV
jgi:phage tail sheath protein FI